MKITDYIPYGVTLVNAERLCQCLRIEQGRQGLGNPSLIGVVQELMSNGWNLIPSEQMKVKGQTLLTKGTAMESDEMKGRHNELGQEVVAVTNLESLEFDPQEIAEVRMPKPLHELLEEELHQP